MNRPSWLLFLALAALLAIGRLCLRPETEFQNSVPLSSATSEKEKLAAGSRMNINDAASDDLVILPNLGSRRAAEIIRYREEHGCFHTVDDLTAIPGIGAKTVNKWRPYLEAVNCP